jgi:protein SCO1/2
MKSENLKRGWWFRVTFLLALMGVVGGAFWLWIKSREAGLRLQNEIQEEIQENMGFYGQVPDFSLIQQNGQTLTLADLKGKVWVADFIYTSCPDTCPLQTAQMTKLQKDLSEEKDVRFVSITVDPERDTPEVLAEYAKRYGADTEKWFFLTGEKESIYRLAKEGFHLTAMEILPEKNSRHASHVHDSQEEDAENASQGHSFSEDQKTPENAPYLHSARFVLIDRQGQIRGYYLGVDSEALQQLLRDVRTLLQEKT